MTGFAIFDDALDAVMNWIETNTAQPTRLEDLVQKCPDGRPRGTRPASTLYQEARASARAGQDEDAMNWLLIAEHHDAGAQNVLRGRRAEVLQRLKS